MIYIIDFSNWDPEFVKQKCRAYQIVYSEFAYLQTCTKVASLAIKERIRQDYHLKGELLTTRAGKPYFANTSLTFNISHHGNFCVAIVAENKEQSNIEKETAEVGIDITDRNTIFNDEEKKQLYSQVPPSGLDGVFWAAREAYLKYLGVGYQENPVNMIVPSHTVFPNLLLNSSFIVLPVMRIESVYARLFSVGPLVGVVIANYKDLHSVTIMDIK